MNKNIFFSLLLILTAFAGSAQCDKKMLLYSSKTEYLNSIQVVQRTVEENTVIEIGKSELTIVPGASDNKMTGVVKSMDCRWKIPFKEGTAVFKAALSDPSGDVKNVTITLEGKNGKLTFLAEIDDTPDQKIKVTIDKFEEKL